MSERYAASTEQVHDDTADSAADVAEFPPLPVTASSPQHLTTAAFRSLSPDTAVEGEALVLRSDALIDRSGSPYLHLTLRGADGGLIEARWWRYPYPVDRRPKTGQVCWFLGTVDQFCGEPQLRVLRARPASNANLSLFARSTTRSLAELQADLEDRIQRLPADLAALVREVLSGEAYERFCEWPASQHHHGAVRHGLLAHTLRVAAIAGLLATAYDVVGLPHDGALVAAACLLHDVGKVRTLSAIAGTALPPDGLQFDHATLGVLMVQSAAARLAHPLAPDRLAALTHALLAHHGRREWGAAVEPQAVEAWLVHLADLAESRLWQWSGEEEGEGKK